MSLTKVVGVIPARYASSRFQGKPLALIQNKEMILWVLEGAKKAKLLHHVFVATDDLRIKQAVEKAGFDAVMTDPQLPSGTDRIFASLNGKKFDIVVNIQGDEPLITGEIIDQLVEPMMSDPHLEMATLAHEISYDEMQSKNSVKVVLNQKSEALYFSRFPIPYSHLKSTSEGSLKAALKHMGLYAYKMSFLESFCRAPQVEIELAENLEQLRALYLGARIKVVKVNERSWGVDTPEDLAKIEEILRIRQ